MKSVHCARLAAIGVVHSRAIKAHWICEQAHQQVKEEMDLDHFEERSWQGLHRYTLMTMIAYAFLQHRRFAAARREKESTARHLNQACLPSITSSSIPCCSQHLHDAHTAANG